MATAFTAPRDTMTAHGPTSPTFIKPEPDDIFASHKFTNKDNFNNTTGNNYAPWQASNTNNINPSDISIGGNNLNNGHSAMAQQHLTSSSPNMSNSNFNSALSEDDILGSFSINNEGQQMNHQYSMMTNGYQSNFGQHMQPSAFSSTPDGAPIQSPFIQSFDYNQWQGNNNQQHHMSHQMSRSVSGHGLQEHMSPMSPNGMQTGHHVQHHAGSINQHTHQRNPSSQWDNSIGSGYSQAFESPLGSPSGGPVHQISEVLKSGTSVSSPATRVNGRATTTAEQKKAKRRASHNEVERRRRNHINERIHDLSVLVPSHRLDDDAMRRSMQANMALPGPLGSGPMGTGISPPGASSIMGSSHGRRAGSVSHGAPPPDDKDKGPAKGEVLDGAVTWTRDLLWLVSNLLERENHMKATIASMNGPAPRAFSEDELRMLSETKDAIAKNAEDIVGYTRRDGSDLFVPGFTDRAGVRMPKDSTSPALFDIEQNHQSVSAGAEFAGFYKSEDDLLPEMEMN